MIIGMIMFNAYSCHVNNIFKYILIVTIRLIVHNHTFSLSHGIMLSQAYGQKCSSHP